MDFRLAFRISEEKWKGTLEHQVCLVTWLETARKISWHELFPDPELKLMCSWKVRVQHHIQKLIWLCYSQEYPYPTWFRAVIRQLRFGAPYSHHTAPMWTHDVPLLWYSENPFSTLHQYFLPWKAERQKEFCATFLAMGS